MKTEHGLAFPMSFPIQLVCIFNEKAMSLLQINVDDNLKKAIKSRAKKYGVPVSSVVKIVLVKAFLDEDDYQGNVFNADRDNAGKGIKIDDLMSML